jgi:hypothetical protein
MSSPRDCLRRVDDAKHRAARASEPFYKSAYEKTAECWMVFARKILSSTTTKKITRRLATDGPAAQ